MLKCKWIWWLYWLSVVVLDQVTKQLSILFLELSKPLAVFPGLNLTLAYNQGAAFSFLADSSGWQRWFFVGFAVIVSAFILVWFRRSNHLLEKAALILILGGAIGNLIDRILLGYVIDFIDVYYQNWHWYTFNIADAAICLGAFIILGLSFKK